MFLPRYRILARRVHPEHVFAFRNTIHFLAPRMKFGEKLIATGGMSGSEGLSALRRYRICCQACGHQWEVRRHRVYPNEVSCLRGQRTEKLDPTEYRGLTARPVVLAKTYEPGVVMVFRPKMTFLRRRTGISLPAPSSP